MATGLELEIAQCVANATYALQAIFICAVETIPRTSEIGFHGGYDWQALSKVPVLKFPDTDDRMLIIESLIPFIESVGLHWETVTEDRIFSDVELLQALMLNSKEQIIAAGINYDGFTPSAHQISAAQDAMQRLHIGPDNYSSMQISTMMDIGEFERLLASTNIWYENDANLLIDKAKQMLESQTSQ